MCLRKKDSFIRCEDSCICSGSKNTNLSPFAEREAMLFQGRGLCYCWAMLTHPPCSTRKWFKCKIIQGRTCSCQGVANNIGQKCYMNIYDGPSLAVPRRLTSKLCLEEPPRWDADRGLDSQCNAWACVWHCPGLASNPHSALCLRGFSKIQSRRGRKQTQHRVGLGVIKKGKTEVEDL